MIALFLDLMVCGLCSAIASHASAVIALTVFIAQALPCDQIWYIFAFCRLDYMHD